MPRFFCTQRQGDGFLIQGEDARHLARSLRMAKGEEITVCDGQGNDYRCVLTEFQGDQLVVAKVLEQHPSTTEPSVAVHLFQALPKGDKMEWVVQKAVEIGVQSITPVLTEFCISRPDAKSAAKKQERYQRIALEAAKQAGRGIIPQIRPLLTFQEALQEMQKADQALFFYEHATEPLQDLPSSLESLSLLVGSEGGFSPREVQQIEGTGTIRTLSMGPRILRCETAALCGVTLAMVRTGNL